MVVVKVLIVVKREREYKEEEKTNGGEGHVREINANNSART